MRVHVSRTPGSRLLIAGRTGARVVVLACAIVFVAGLVLWARETSLEAERWSLPASWSEAGLRRVAAEARAPIPVISAYFMLLELIVATAGVGVAVMLLRGEPGWFRIYISVALAIWSTLGGAIAVVLGGALGGWAHGVQGVGWMAVFPIAYLFPDGRFVPSWTRWAVLGWLAYLPAMALLEVVGFGSDAESPVQVIPILVLFATAAYAGVHRYRKVSTPEQKQQARGLVTALLLWVAVSVLSVATPLRVLKQDVTITGLVANGVVLTLSYLVAALIPLSIGMAVLRYRLFAMDPWIARSVAYALLTVILVAVYAAAAAIGAMLWPGDTLAGPMFAVVVLAAVLHPLRLVLQRRADRFVYGHSLAPKDLIDGLRRSRERILIAREDERRRLQRDLHDGLGPTLASLYQRVDAARALVTTDPVATETLLASVGTQTRAVIDDIRGLVHSLRPPELDQLGLAGSIEWASSKLPDLDVVIAETLRGRLPAIVEVAAYRIATEAITNAARHSGATNVTIHLDCDPQALAVMITDNGRGLSDDARPGTGIASMRERAEELGGSLDLTSVPGEGTRLRAVLPVGGLE